MEDRTYTMDDWAALEAESPDVRYEFVDGLIVARAGGTLRHAQIKHNVERWLGNTLEGRCNVAGSDVRIETVGKRIYRLPDVVVYCDEPQLTDIPGVGEALKNPTLLVEVLSDSTARADLEVKFAEYMALSSVEEYWVGDPDKTHVIQYLRGGHYAVYTSDEARLTSETLGLEMPLKEIYT